MYLILRIDSINMSDQGIPLVKQEINETHMPICYTIPPNTRTKIMLKTVPNGACTLHHEDNINLKQSLKIYADQAGTIRFHISPKKESKEPRKLVINCEADGKIIRFPIELHISSNPTEEMPFSSQESLSVATDASLRPAPSEEDLKHISKNEFLPLAAYTWPRFDIEQVVYLGNDEVNGLNILTSQKE